MPGLVETRSRWFILLLAFPALALAQVRTDAAAEIRAARERSNQALATRDIKALAEGLAPDYVMIRGNGVFVPSLEAYTDRIGEDFKDPNAVRYKRTPNKIEISSAAPLAAEHGDWTATLPNGKQAYSGTYVAMWRRIGSAWKIRSELFVMLNCDVEAICAGYRK